MSYIAAVCYLIVSALAFMELIPSVVAQESVTVTVDSSTVVRANSRHLMGHNLSFVENAYGTWDPGTGEFEESFWKPFMKVAPGIVRFPGGNWTYGYHFDLARQGIAHQVNTASIPKANHDFRPQHFLKLIKDLNAERIESTPLIHPSAQFTSPEEAAAWVAYMIAPSTSNCRVIGPDSWGRKYDGEDLQWHDTCYWGLQREQDNPNDPSPYTGTLYLQLGNEEWISACNPCDGMTDAYGITRSSRSMTIRQQRRNPPQVTPYWPKYKALWAKLRGPDGLFTAEEVQVGALGYAGIKTPQGARDQVLRNGHGWNRVLLTEINNDADTSLDFLTIHTYMYDENGWQKHSAVGQRHNVLASHDHLRARIEQIRHQVNPPLSKPIYITEYNTHIHPENAPPQRRNILASSLIDALHTVNWTAEAMYNGAIGGLVRWQIVTIEEKANKAGGHTLFVKDKQNPDIIWRMSSFYAAKLLAALHPTVVDVRVAEHAGFQPKGFSSTSWTWWEGYNTRTKIGPEIPYLTAAATLSADGNELALLLLNRNTVDDYSVSLDLGNFTPSRKYTRIELDSVVEPAQGHKALLDQNGFGPNAVERVALRESVGSYRGTIDIGPHQAIVIKLSASDPQPNQPPIADAGEDQTVDEGVQVVLDGSASFDPDPDGSIVGYRWVHIGGPSVTMNNADSVQMSFEAPDVSTDTLFEFMLRVTDDQEETGTDIVTVTVRDTTPPAAPGMTEVLNGGSSGVPSVDFAAGQTTAQVSYGNPEGHPVKGFVERWSGEDGWRWVTTIDETAGETVAGMSPGWVDLGAHVFQYDGKLGNGRWAVPKNRTKAFRIRLRLKIDGSWCCWAGDWLRFNIKR